LKRLLSIDGGGIRGVLPAMVLAELERMASAPCAHLFDMIAGTSTGGIIACGLVADKPATALVDLYVKRGGEIFSRTLWEKFDTGFGLSGPKYDAAPLEAILADVLGDLWMSEVPNRPELLVPSYCIQLPRPVVLDGVVTTRSSYLFKSSESGDAQADFRLRDVARATSAAPTYFAPAQITAKDGDVRWMVDGGVFANQPSACALAEARKLWPGEEYEILSVGTGSLEAAIDPKNVLGWGLGGWLRPLLSVMMNGAADSVSYQMATELGPAFARLDISTNAINPAVDEAMDDASPQNIERLQALAEALLGREDSKAALAHFAKGG
jgi:uncharacterized protein